MICAQILNSVGLGLGVIGVLVIFKWGPPQPSFDGGVATGLEDATPLPGGGTVADQKVETEKRKTVFKMMSGFGLALIGLGFVFQIIAVWVP